MPFQSAPQCASAAILATVAGKQVANVLNFHFHSGVPAQSDLDALATAVDFRVASSYLTLISTSVHYDEVHVRGLTSIIDMEASDNTNAGNGTAGGLMAPANATNCITLRTGHTGRSARGRFYALPTTTALQATGQLWDGSYTTALVTMLNALKVDSLSIGWDMVVLSRFSAGVRRVTATHLDVTVAEARNSDIDSQRGRLLPNH